MALWPNSMAMSNYQMVKFAMESQIHGFPMEDVEQITRGYPWTNHP